MSNRPIAPFPTLSALLLLIAFAAPLPGFAASIGLPSPYQKLKAKPQKASRFKSADEVVDWINTYRSAPEPDRVPEAIRALRGFGAFQDPDQSGMYVGFLAGVLGNNQLRAGDIVEHLFPMPPKDQAIIIKAIAYSGLPDWRQLLTDFIERMPDRKVMIDSFLFGKNKPLFEAPLDQSPELVDALWGYYIATGYLLPVQRILLALDWVEKTEDADRFTLSQMAMWTLAANAERDRSLLRFYDRQLPQLSKTAAGALGKAIHAAERFESFKLKKEVIEKIAARSREKPGKYAKWAWPAKAGETAIAVGCVAATALGQTEVAAPCIITGAIYSGVRKMMFEGN